MDDNLLRAKVGRAPSSIRALIDRPAAEVEPETIADGVPSLDELTPLPRPGDPYKAFGRPAAKPLLTLCFLKADSSREAFAYADLRRYRFPPAEQAGGGPVIVLRFVEAVTTEVRIEGRNLDTLFDYLCQHRTGWVRELPQRRDFIDADAAVVTRITIQTAEG